MKNGLAYGPFRDGQSPDYDVYPGSEQIREDLEFIGKLTKQIRIYGTKGTYAEVPRLAKKLGVHVTQGIYLGRDEKENEKEIENAVKLARAGLVERVVVGNETLTSQRLTKEKLVSYIEKVREEIAPAKVPIGTAEVWGVWDANPDLAKHVDFVEAHFYPFWEHHGVEGAAASVIEQYRALEEKLKKKYPGQHLTLEIGETGWPSAGEHASGSAAVPSPQNQRKYLEEFMTLACGNAIQFYYFEAFDEEWKWIEGSSATEDGSALPRDRTFSGRRVGSSWGIYASSGRLKPQFSGLFDESGPASRLQRDIFVDGQLSTFYGAGVDSSEKRRDWLKTELGSFKMTYPSDQHWGAVFITVGDPGPRPHPWKDFSEFGTLSVELRGEKGGETVGIGVMGYSDPATGNEKKVTETLSSDYKFCDIPLSSFASSHLSVPADLKKIYVVVEFVFTGAKPETIYVRSVRYKPREVQRN